MKPFRVHTRHGAGRVIGIRIKHPRPVYVVQLDSENDLVAMTLPELWKEDPETHEASDPVGHEEERA